MAQLYAGTSGFAYPAWKPSFYPAKLPSKQFLEHYATRLNAVEINYTFRRLPNAATLEGWVKQTQAGFLFAVKAHQRITHIRRLKDSEEATSIFFRAIDPLRTSGHLGPVLFQLPPNFRCNAEVLAAFLTQLPTDVRCAFEFRHASWLNQEIYGLLEKHRAGLCLAESDKFEVPEVVTADFVYCRLRKEEYTPDDRRAVAAKARELLAGGKDVFVFFKHEETPDGALYAEEILRG
ncbi:MAG: DUF72 domain-containing protein [Acidobacteria bacterium]|nr:DUF72 domain-containing protein [Acidobacteriota bacterium]